jgi:cell division protein FtsB
VDRLRRIIAHPWIQEMRDVRVMAFMVFGVILVLVSWSTVGVIQTNYELGKKITRLEQQNEVYNLENTNLKLKNEYYNTDQYLELTARRQFGRGAPGEQMYIVPKNIALQHTVPMPSSQEKAIASPPSPKSRYQKNFEAWMDFFFHRTTDY